MASKGTPYSYKALSVPNCIRLIGLQPALFPDEPLRCSLRHVHLSNCEALYEALSYTWGHPDLTHPLYVDDGDSYILVTANLNRALRRLRHPVIVRSLWADAVCINQNSNEEKAYQIPLMTTIYRQAKMVVAWVDGGPEEEHGMQLLDSLSRLRRKIFDHQSRSLQEEFMNISTLHSISKFLNLPWFTRLWVVQEIVFNVDVVLLCGKHELTWMRLITAVGIIRNAFVDIANLIGHHKLDALGKVANLWQHHCMIEVEGHHSQRSSLDREENAITILDTFFHYGCSDDRDRIYALYTALDLEPKESQTVPGPTAKLTIYMDVDYSLDTQETYLAFTSACVASYRATTILNAVLSRQHHMRQDSWPSWVPDWRHPTSKSHILLPEDIECIIALCPSRKLSLRIQSLGTPRGHGYPQVESKMDSVYELISSLARANRPCQTSKFSFMLHNLLVASYSIYDCHSYIRGVAEHVLEPNARPNDSSLESMSHMIDAVEGAMRGQCFFIAVQPNTSLYSIGFGTHALKPGDKVLPFADGYHPSDIDRQGGFQALLLRSSPSTTGGSKTQRLMGSAYISMPCNGYQLQEVYRQNVKIVDILLN